MKNKWVLECQGIKSGPTLNNHSAMKDNSSYETFCKLPFEQKPIGKK